MPIPTDTRTRLQAIQELALIAKRANWQAHATLIAKLLDAETYEDTEWTLGALHKHGNTAMQSLATQIDDVVTEFVSEHVGPCTVDDVHNVREGAAYEFVLIVRDNIAADLKYLAMQVAS